MNKKTVAVLLAVAVVLSCSVVAFAATDAGGGLFGALKEIAAFIKRIFVPDPNYFHNKLADLSERVNDRFGGLAYLYQMIDSFFNTLMQTPSMELLINIPNNFLFRGYQGFSLNFFTSAKPFVDFLRNVLNASCCLLTGVICYKKLLSFFHH